MSEEAEKLKPTAWDVPAIDGGDGRGYMTASKLEALQQQAFDEAFKQGFEDGQEKGRQEVAGRVQRLDQLLHAFEKPLENLDSEVEQQLVELAMSVARQLFRREMKTEPAHVIGVVREAIQLLPAASRNTAVHLHPDDATLVRESLSLTDAKPGWTITEDPLLTRGGCRVSTDNSQVDATAEARLTAVIASIVGDERQS